MKTGLIIQARTGSTRFPNKIVIPFFEGKCILELLIERIKAAQVLSSADIVIATSESNRDDIIFSIADQLGVKVFRGPEQDVLKRFILAAQMYNFDKIIRVCSDNLFIDVKAFKYLYHRLEVIDSDYYSFITSEGLPSIKTHFGLFLEAVTLEALQKANSYTNSQFYHEHVTNYLYEHRDTFKCDFIQVNDVIPHIEDYADLRLTIDTPMDFKIQREIYSNLVSEKEEISPQNILCFLENRPDIYDIMKKIILKNLK